jgi:hypothetical protein
MKILALIALCICVILILAVALDGGRYCEPGTVGQIVDKYKTRKFSGPKRVKEFLIRHDDKECRATAKLGEFSQYEIGQQYTVR